MNTVKVVLYFPKELIDKPILYNFSQNFKVKFNILKASINPDKEGIMVLELSGDRIEIEKGVIFFESKGIKVHPLSKHIKIDESKCVHCGACVALCPSGSFTVERPSMYVNFDNSKCLACGLCLKVCPLKAVVIDLW